MILKLPRTWEQTLKQVQVLFPEAVIAGGALRDTIMGKPIGDIDIFVQSRGVYTEAHLKFLFGDKVEKISEDWNRTYGEWLPELDSVWSIGKRDENLKPFQVIALNLKEVTPQTVIDRIDFGICRVAHDGETLLVSNAFTSDMVGHTFTVLRAHNKDSTWKRYSRFTNKDGKYEGWSLNDPDGLLKLPEKREAPAGLPNVYPDADVDDDYTVALP